MPNTYRATVTSRSTGETTNALVNAYNHTDAALVALGRPSNPPYKGSAEVFVLVLEDDTYRCVVVET